METRIKFNRLLSAVMIASMLLGALSVKAAPLAQAPLIIIDGVKDAAWGAPLASDPIGDMSEPNLDLQGLYLVEDADNYYIGFDATASTWGMAYGIYIDADQVDGSGAISDPWGRAVNAVAARLPEHTLYVWHDGGDFLQDVQLNHWDGSGWSYDSLVSQGGAQAYSASNDWVEYRLPKAALGNPSRIALELFTTGGDGHAQDSVPSDPNIAYASPDWSGDVTTLSAFALYPELSLYVRGDFNGWGTADPLFDDGTHGDVIAKDGIYTTQIGIATANRYEFKVATSDWSTGFPGSGNSWLETTIADQTVTFTFDANTYSDGWLPATNIIAVNTDPSFWTAVGDWQGWDNADPATAMSALGGGLYEFTATIAAPGNYQFKAVKTGTWDAVGADGRSVNAATATFTTVQADQQVTFSVDALAGRVNVEVAAPPPVPGPDDDIWWDGLGHNSRDDLYRVPGGAVTTGVPVTLRFRTFHNDVTSVILRVWSTTANAQSLYPMEKVATTDDPPYGYDYWQFSLPAQDTPTILYYRFIVRDGSDEDYYEDDDLFDGGWGTTYEDSPDYSFQIDVYQPDFQTPDWMKDAVVYQIFPDRFYNGDPKIDAQPTDPSVYDNPVLVKDWDNLPEGYCRSYEVVPCDEAPQGRDFFGGDLQGVLDKLDYLQELGVTAIYFNPIFEAPSNHLYDTTDYFQIDTYFGSIGTFRHLVNEAKLRGINIILDGVFNHTSSDSLYFDKYSRYPTVGAFESQSSPYYDWYTFYEWPDNYNSWWGFDSLPVLTEIQAVRDFIYGETRSVATWWLRQDAMGWRLDVAPDKSHDWWQEFRPSVKSINPDAVIVGEIWDDASPWLLGNEFDSTMNYRFRRAMLGFLNGDSNDPNQGAIRGLDPEQFDSVLQSIREDYPPPAYAAAMNLVGSHDTQRILWALTPGLRNREDREFNSANLETGKAKLKLLAIIQMTMPGAPTVYYGDEVGLTGDTDPDDRRPFPWDNQDADLLENYQTLIGLRNQHSFLRTGSFDSLYTQDSDGIYVYGRKDETGAAVIAINRDISPHEVMVDLAGYIPDGTQLSDAFNGGSYTVIDGQISLTVDSRWGAILVTPSGVDLTPPPAPDGLAVAAGNGVVDLTWNSVSGAAGYNLYRSPVSGGGYERLNDTPLSGVSSSDDTVTNGRLYYYVVTALDAFGNESAYSGEAEALPYAPIGWAGHLWPPEINMVLDALNPQTVYAQVYAQGLTDAPGQGSGILAEFGFGPNGSDPRDWAWTSMHYNVDAGNNDEYWTEFIPESAGDFEYLARFSTNLGRDWTYAYTDDGTRGQLTVQPSNDTTPPAAPANLTLKEASPNFITLAWDAVTDSDLYRYEVLRAGTSGGPYTKIANVPGGVTDYSDLDVARDTTYYYVVLAVDNAFNRSPYSNEIQATSQARSVQVTFNATLPDTTPLGDDIYIGGSFNGWDPAGTLMDRISDYYATVTLTFDEGSHIEYKYTRGSWDYVEKGAACEEIANRSQTIFYGSDGTMNVDDSVLNWRNTGSCPN
jgi:glycosidase